MVVPGAVHNGKKDQCSISKLYKFIRKNVVVIATKYVRYCISAVVLTGPGRTQVIK